MNRWITGFLLIVFFAGWQLLGNHEDTLSGKDVSKQRPVVVKSHEEAVETLVQQEPLHIKVVLKEHYKDGVIETTTKNETIWSMMDFWSSYGGWTVVDQTLDQVVFKRQVNDISPLTKREGYFGLNDKGELAVFYGSPEDGKVIESFKPIPIKPLETKRKTELQDGIKINNLKHFKQVLNQYTDKQSL
ncbi:intercompartmental signaling factor BofC [Halobacillus salinarum]|uniref:Intercompartmental signaling factor BofC n=1 Tax=Halobacillus salinarum TaxID=2932257 RepID=A0ABY4EP81_9BACI|nr:BofC C-terminal domain-containing protein [Halobacillus salinarum]UOQ46266.1 intercompartmental signaling factor BofC [Halobacillus salinarum]